MDSSIYLMLKPPPTIAHAIHRLRSGFGISDAYGLERLHVTLLPLGDSRLLCAAALAQLLQILALVAAEPFPLVFRQLYDNELRPAKPASLRTLQRTLVDRIRARGLLLPNHRFRPHLSLAYGDRVSRRGAISPLGWTVDEFLLVESVAGRHKLLGRWPLIQRQHPLDLWPQSSNRDVGRDEAIASGEAPC